MTFLLFVMVIERVLLWAYWSWECWQSSICLALKRKRRKEKKAHINWNATWSFTPVACPGVAAELVSKVLGRIPPLNISSESLSADLLQLFGDSSKVAGAPQQAAHQQQYSYRVTWSCMATYVVLLTLSAGTGLQSQVRKIAEPIRSPETQLPLLYLQPLRNSQYWT